MTASANRKLETSMGNRGSYPSAAVHHYEGGMVFIAAGYGTTAIGSGGVNRFAGVCLKECDNSGGSAGDKDVEVQKCGEVKLLGSGFAQTDLLKKVYASDNDTVTTTSTNYSLVGRIKRVISSTEVMVDLDTLN